MKLCTASRGCPLKDNCTRYKIDGHYSEFMGSTPFNNFTNKCKYYIPKQIDMARIEDKFIIKELKRELDMKNRFYPQWIISGRITKHDAAHRVAIFEQLIADFESGKLKSQPLPEQTELFNEEETK